jgi:dihydroorotase
LTRCGDGLEALHRREIRIIISDEQAASSFKGFGDSHNNVPCLLELEQEGVLTLPEVVGL